MLPGFVDAHVHGALGTDFGALGSDPGPAVEHHARHGSTTLVASIATAEPRTTCDRLRELAPLVRDGALAGLHLEGPFLAAGRRGAHDPALLRAPDRAAVDELLSAADGALAVVTLAPELPGALDAVRHLTDAGVVVAIGHTEASAEVVGAAAEAGATLVTHLFNGMPPLHHREPGPVGAALADPRLSVELIGDGHHVADLALDAARAAARGRTLLVSDAMAATGLGDGRYRLAGSDVVVTGGVAMLADGSSLAGSTTPVGGAAQRLLDRGADPAQVVALTRTAPARVLGLSPEPLGPGSAADLVVVERSRITRTMRKGAWLPSSS